MPLLALAATGAAAIGPGPGPARSAHRRPSVAMANLSRFHPDWGMSPAEHEAQKARRAAGEVAYIPKDGLARRRTAMLKGAGL